MNIVRCFHRLVIFVFSTGFDMPVCVDFALYVLHVVPVFITHRFTVYDLDYQFLFVHNVVSYEARNNLLLSV